MVRGKKEEEEEAGYLIFMAALARGGGGGGCVVICSAGSGDFPERWVKKTEKLSRRSSIDLLQYLHCEEGKKQFKHQLLGTYWWKEKQKEPSFHFFLLSLARLMRMGGKEEEEERSQFSTPLLLLLLSILHGGWNLLSHLLMQTWPSKPTTLWYSSIHTCCICHAPAMNCPQALRDKKN